MSGDRDTVGEVGVWLFSSADQPVEPPCESVSSRSVSERHADSCCKLVIWQYGDYKGP
ncbi:hypothetical protein CANTEDRAFT_116089 [Yamadazyma tenuis ATCC 10573]|uniref:Uncharacterized protein n=1 Tax=Candida tenuis (strain ATCC 10573 / BCRC 21748 / CBS 615 / JCM 9827 / NBRC 10315 / NRRL Y-1498 / VKM Y-70) TaxID=590646 RepID=G3BFN6_CANTC|nr:uncharacterized protein CANTEDRAFT_116089 [Yamadazyma tenuis ATCC 10573]EGV60061.1 hypothetical protein CANTEDRAFT_116089 [Yamadazyma tenuis ATCC 10573]